MNNAKASKPSPRDTADSAGIQARQVVVPERSEQKEDVSGNQRARRNKNEFSHALNHLPTENIPSYTREFDSILTFPEKFMLMMVYIERSSSSAGRQMEQEAIHWTRNGTVVVVRNPNELVSKYLRRFFGDLKYESFVRKAYRWQFRKSPPIVYDLPLDCQVFSNRYFCRDQTDLLCQMKSTTAAKVRSASKAAVVTSGPNQDDETPAQNSGRVAETARVHETAWNSVPDAHTSLLSSSQLQLVFPIQQVPNHATLLAQQLRNLRLQNLLTSSMLSPVRNDAMYGTSALDLMMLRLRLNQPLQPQASSVQELLQLLHHQNNNRSLQGPTALEELLRRLRQNPPR